MRKNRGAWSTGGLGDKGLGRQGASRDAENGAETQGGSGPRSGHRSGPRGTPLLRRPVRPRLEAVLGPQRLRLFDAAPGVADRAYRRGPCRRTPVRPARRALPRRLRIPLSRCAIVLLHAKNFLRCHVGKCDRAPCVDRVTASSLPIRWVFAIIRIAPACRQYASAAVGHVCGAPDP